MTTIQTRSTMGCELVRFSGGDALTIQAARVSTRGANVPEEGEGRGLLTHLERWWHHVPFEHTVFTFLFTVPIFVSRQLVKHRITNISEESGRYRELKPVFWVPGADRDVVQVGKTGDYTFMPDTDALVVAKGMIGGAAMAAWTNYEMLLKRGIAKEVARTVLPVTTYTSMYFTINARSLFNFLNLRTDPHAQREIRDLAEQVEEFFEEKMPWTYAAWKESQANRIDLRDVDLDAAVRVFQQARNSAYDLDDQDATTGAIAAVLASLRKDA